MGQATVDLPDPLQNTGPAEAKSADDLLAQLAGDEIDRLLAETDDEPVVGESINSFSEPVEKSLASVEPPVPATVGDENSDPVSAALNSITVAPDSNTAVQIGTLASASAIDLDAVLETAVADRDAAARAALNTPAVTAVIDQSPKIDLGESRLPLFLRPLEWLSSPLDPWPDQFRDLLGKIGLMTLINALAVLAYVLLFRKHHL